MTHRPDPPLTDDIDVRVSLAGQTPQGAIQLTQTVRGADHLERLQNLLRMFNIERRKCAVDAPVDNYTADAFIDNPNRRHVLLNGSDTSRMAWRIIKWQSFRLRDADRRISELEAMLGGEDGIKWRSKVEKAG
jgi:hypothetical protein